MRKGTQAWQKAKGHQPTDRLSDEQTAQLIKDALKERDSVGWSILRDPAVGFAIGVPTKLASFGTPHIDGSTLYYSRRRHDYPVDRLPSRLSDLPHLGRRTILL